MKYETPKYEIVVMETEEILTASSDFEISKENASGAGKILLDFLALFR